MATKTEQHSSVLELNLGPQHPSTHGVLRLKLKIEGEKVLSAEPVIGYLHTGIEKECESRSYQQIFTLVDRADYLSAPFSEQVFADAVEHLIGLEVPERAQHLRVILMELSRITSHLLWLGTSALELNMSSVFMYCFAEREKILSLFEEISGARMFPSYWRIGGVAHDTTPAFEATLQQWMRAFPALWKELDGLLTDNYVWCSRTQGIGLIDRQMCFDLMATGPVLRAAGEPYDLRKITPYSGYERYTFSIPTRKEGDSYARYLVRMEEMLESLSIVEQAIQAMRPGPILHPNRKFTLPPREELVYSMEAVIHQFKLTSRGVEPPRGTVYRAVESPRGELGHYLVSDGSHHPYRLRIRDPSFAHVALLEKILPGLFLSDVVVVIASMDPILGGVDR